jgi:hypothetical protein
MSRTTATPATIPPIIGPDRREDTVIWRLSSTRQCRSSVANHSPTGILVAVDLRLAKQGCQLRLISLSHAPVKTGASSTTHAALLPPAPLLSSPATLVIVITWRFHSNRGSPASRRGPGVGPAGGAAFELIGKVALSTRVEQWSETVSRAWCDR